MKNNRKNPFHRDFWSRGWSRCAVYRFHARLPMRCKYCHNPEIWQENCGEDWQAEALLKRLCVTACTGKMEELQSAEKPSTDRVLDRIFKLAKQEGNPYCT